MVSVEKIDHDNDWPDLLKHDADVEVEVGMELLSIFTEIHSRCSLHQCMHISE